MKKAFTIVEVSILFVIFLIVAFLVAPLSLDDTIQVKNASRWRGVQNDFVNIFYSVSNQYSADSEDENVEADFGKTFDAVMNGEIQADIGPYKITYLNGTFPTGEYKFNNFKLTHSNAVVAYKLNVAAQPDAIGIMMYDVNGETGPNVWGKDVFGYNIYTDRFEPFCKKDALSIQEKDCSRSGTGLCCSNYYLIGGKLK